MLQCCLNQLSCLDVPIETWGCHTPRFLALFQAPVTVGWLVVLPHRRRLHHLSLGRLPPTPQRFHSLPMSFATFPETSIVIEPEASMVYIHQRFWTINSLDSDFLFSKKKPSPEVKFRFRNLVVAYLLSSQWKDNLNHILRQTNIAMENLGK